VSGGETDEVSAHVEEGERAGVSAISDKKIGMYEMRTAPVVQSAEQGGTDGESSDGRRVARATSSVDGERARARGVRATSGDGGVSERADQGADEAAQVSIARQSEGVDGAVVGGDGVQRVAMDPAVVAPGRERVGSDSGDGLRAQDRGSRARKRAEPSRWAAHGRSDGANRRADGRKRLEGQTIDRAETADRFRGLEGIFHSPSQGV